MLDPNSVLRTDWLKLVEAARFLSVYPGILYRRWRYGQLPEGACVKVDNTLFFNRDALEQIRSAKATTKTQQPSMKSHD